MYSDNSKNHGPWSISKLDVAKNCALRFKYKYIDKEREPEVSDGRGRVGKAAHLALELTLKGQDLSRAMKKAAIDEKLTTTEADDLLAYKANVIDFLDRYAKYKEKHQATGQFVEKRFGLTEDFKPAAFFGKDVFFRGVIDLGVLLPDEVMIIIDHKSGQRYSVNKYASQLKSYAIAGIAMNPKTTGVQTALHWVKDKAIDWAKFTSREEIENKLKPWLVEYINNCTETIVVDAPQPNKGPWCTFCGYKAKCPSWA